MFRLFRTETDNGDEALVLVPAAEGGLKRDADVFVFDHSITYQNIEEVKVPKTV
jgi:hypothetical protein